MASDPFLPSPKQLEAAALADARLISLSKEEEAISAAREEIESLVARAQAEVTRYREEVLIPAERAFKQALFGLRPLVGEVRKAKALYGRHLRKRQRIDAMKKARLQQLKAKLAHQNLVASQRELIAHFRSSGRRRNINKPEFMQCKSSDTQTGATTPTSSPPPAPSSSA